METEIRIWVGAVIMFLGAYLTGILLDKLKVPFTKRYLSELIPSLRVDGKSR